MVPLPFLVILLLAAGCGRAVEPAAGDTAPVEEAAYATGGTGSAAVTYQANVRIVERGDGLRGLRGVSREGSTLLFEARTPEIAHLRPGDVLLIEGLLAHRVLATERYGDEIAVLGEPASLTDVVRDGRIELDVPIRFTPATPPVALSARGARRHRIADLLVPAALAQAPDAEALKESIEAGEAEAAKSLAKNVVAGIFEGWDITFSAEPTDGRLDLSIVMAKEVGGFVALVTGKGYVADFDLSSDIEISSSRIEQLELIHKRLNGVMNFTWEVAKDSPGAFTGNDRIKLPAALSIPLYRYLDGLPLFLEISAAMIIRPAISGGQQYSHGSFRVTYDGTQGFKLKEGTIDADGQVTGDIEFLTRQNVSVAPHGFVVAMAAPRIELTFGTTKIVEMDHLKSAAEKADRIAEALVEAAFGQDGLERLRSSPLGSASISKAVENVVASDATGYVELVTSAGMSHTGISVIRPCTRTDIIMTIKAGASAQALGQELGKVETEVFRHDITRIEPPGTRLCEEVGG